MGMIQSNINQTISLAGFLWTQTKGKEMAENREVKKALGSAQKQIDKAIERAPLDYSGNRGENISVDAAYDVYNRVLEKYGTKDPELAVEARYEQLATQKEQQEQQQEALKKPSSVEEARETVDALIEQYTPSKSEQMADKAADYLAEEQSRLRGENKIDRRKIHKQSLREKGRKRAEKKKTGGITNE